MKNHLKIIAAWLLCTFLLSACSGTFAYNRLDWLIPWYANTFVDLSSEQQQSFRDQLVPLLQWHRQEELAQYQQMLDQVETEMENPLSASQVQSWIKELLLAGTRIEESTLEVALEFGSSFSNEQMTEFIQSLYEQQDEYEEKYLSRTDAEYVAENAEHMQKLLEKLLGRLQTDQKELLQQGAQSMQRFDTEWLNDRRLWLEQLEPLLARKTGWQQQVVQAHQYRLKSRTAQYQQILDYNTQVIAKTMADILNSRTDKQQTHAVRKFDDMRATLQELINAPGAKSDQVSPQ